ncbi:hypothetical protein J3E68DRAFT_412245 [Trichoderma sp. SZMC 28012]
MCGPAGSICICICILLVRVHAFQLCLQHLPVERGGDTLHPTNRHTEPVTQDAQYCRFLFILILCARATFLVSWWQQ